MAQPAQAAGQGALLVLFDIDGTLLIRASAEHARAVLDAIAEVWAVAAGEGIPVAAAGRTDTEIAREILLLLGVDARTIDERARRLPRRRGAPLRRARAGRPDRAPGAGAAEVARRRWRRAASTGCRS